MCSNCCSGCAMFGFGSMAAGGRDVSRSDKRRVKRQGTGKIEIAFLTFVKYNNNRFSPKSEENKRGIV